MGPRRPLSLTVSSIRATLLSAAAGLLLLASPLPAGAVPLDLLIEGRVTASEPPYLAPGGRFGLELGFDEGDLWTLYFYPHLITNDAIQVGLMHFAADYRYDDGVWFNVTAHHIDIDSGEIIPPENVDTDNPNMALRVILEFEAFEERGGGQAPDSVWARVELWYGAAGMQAGPLGNSDDFQAALRGGEVELRSAGETVLTGTLVPEPDTALLAGLGLASLAALRRRVSGPPSEGPTARLRTRAPTA